ncbi:MAG: family 10 glycosylhydrolase [Victivallales bacterium]|nr:family 10 glycosylhydrolase [Victivallales bacterium]
MSKLYIILIIICIGLRGFLGAELRGAWIHSPSGIEDKRGWDATVKALAENGYNALFANFAWAGCADYPSSVVEPHPSLYDSEGNCQDCLQECLDACRKYGIQLHVWIVICNLGHRTPERVKTQFCQEGRVQLDADGKESDYLAPHLLENQILLRDLATEVVSRYPVDGLHLDYIRYPGAKYDFSPSARKAFEGTLGRAVKQWPEDCQSGGKDYEAFLQWRRDNITALVRLVRNAVKPLRPGLQFTAAVYGYWPSARNGIAQDAEAWAIEGLVDALCPMNYSKDAWEAGTWLRQQLRVVDGRVPIYTGLANYMTPTVTDLAEQITDARKCGADGFVTFQLRQEFADDWLPELHESVTCEPAEPPLGDEPRLSATWAKPPLEFPWRFFRFWRRGDRIRCVAHLPDGYADIASKSLQVSLLHNGIRMEEWPGRAWRLSNGSLRLEFTPDQRGYYRWEVLWQDNTGRAHEWRSSSRFVR